MLKTFLRVMFLTLVAFVGGYYVGQSKPTVALAQATLTLSGNPPTRTLRAPQSWGTLKGFNADFGWFEDANGTARQVVWGQSGPPEVMAVLTHQ